MKKKKLRNHPCGFNKLSPPATQPTSGGIAPISDPGITALGVIFFNGVYTPLYQKRASQPKSVVVKPVVYHKMNVPARISV